MNLENKSLFFFLFAFKVASNASNPGEPTKTKENIVKPENSSKPTMKDEGIFIFFLILPSFISLYIFYL